MSPNTVELVQRSWAQVVPISDAAANLFYDRLFELDPSVRALFKSDMGQQKKKLMQTLSVAVDGLSHPARLIPVLEQLGVRHAGYMVQDHHYDLVGEALLWTLREGLGDAYSQELDSAWKEVYGLVSTIMKKAVASTAASKPPVSPPAPEAPPPVPEDLSEDVPVTFSAPPTAPKATGDETIPYHLMAQSQLLGLQSLAQQPPTGEERPPASASVSIPLNVPREVTVNLNLNLKLEADSALRALMPRPAKVELPTPKPATPEPPSRAAVSPFLLVALCVLVSVSTVIALGPLGQAASSLSLADLPRLAAPVFTVAALAIGYLWGRGRGSDRHR